MNRRFSRVWIAGVVCLVAASQSGCFLFRAPPEAQEIKPPPVARGDAKDRTVEGVVNYLNDQASAINSLDTRDLQISVWAKNTSVGLDSGSLQVQKPRYLRLVGNKFGAQQVVAGSNQERFWFFAEHSDNAMRHCTYTDFDRGVELPLPFHPDWVLEALGMATITKTEGMRLEESSQTVRLVEESSFRGQPVRKVTEFYKGNARPKQPQVRSRVMYDAHGRVICSATVKRSIDLPPNHPGGQPVKVPQVITLEWPAEDTKLQLDLGEVKVNQQLAPELFQMPRLGARQIDLGRDQPTARRLPARYR